MYRISLLNYFKNNNQRLFVFRKFYIIVIVISLNACVSNNKARFYHDNYGVVDGNHTQVQIDGQTCVIDYAETFQPTESQIVANDLSEEAYYEGDKKTEYALNVMVTAIEGYQLAKNQSTCMTAKGWKKLEPKK